MNDGGDCRTAPATPGLLNMQKYVKACFTEHQLTSNNKKKKIHKNS